MNGLGMLIPRFLVFNRTGSDSSDFIFLVGINDSIVRYKVLQHLVYTSHINPDSTPLSGGPHTTNATVLL